MENINPLLRTISRVKSQIEQGDSLKIALLEAAQDETDRSWKNILLQHLEHYQSGRPVNQAIVDRLSVHRQIFLSLMSSGWRGESVYSQLKSLEEDVAEACQLEIDELAALLPLKALIPLVALQLPGLMILIIGPLIMEFLTS